LEVEAFHEPQPEAERWGQKDELIFLPPSFCLFHQPRWGERPREPVRKVVSDGARGRSPHPPRFMAPMRVQSWRWRLSMNRNRRQKDGGRKMNSFFCPHFSAFSINLGGASVRASRSGKWWVTAREDARPTFRGSRPRCAIWLYSLAPIPLPNPEKPA